MDTKITAAIHNKTQETSVGTGAETKYWATQHRQMGKAWVLSASPGLVGLSSYSSHSLSKKRPGAQTESNMCGSGGFGSP
eukprot:6050247-Pyramimonas_sp.AAC.1